MSKRKKTNRPKAKASGARPQRGGGGRRPAPRRLSAREKRDLRAKAKRQRQVQAMGIGFKERFMSGCIAVGFVSFFALLAWLAWVFFFAAD